MAIGAMLLVFLVSVGALLLIAAVAFGSGLEWLAPKVGLIRLEGPIWDSREFLEDLEWHLEDQKVKALVLRIDSPGGAVGASQEIYRALMTARSGEDPGLGRIPLVASMGNVAASGGYYVAAACDHVVANPGTLTGSIGVIFETTEITELSEKLGLDFNTIKSGEFKDSGSATREMTEKDRLLLQSIIDDVHGQFVDDVLRGRYESLVEAMQDASATTGAAGALAAPSEASVRGWLAEVTDGRVLTGEQAFQRGLVDELGNLDDAFDAAVEMADLPGGARWVERPRPAGLRDLFMGAVAGASRAITGGWRPPLQFRAVW